MDALAPAAPDTDPPVDLDLARRRRAGLDRLAQPPGPWCRRVPGCDCCCLAADGPAGCRPSA